MKKEIFNLDFKKTKINAIKAKGLLSLLALYIVSGYQFSIDYKSINNKEKDAKYPYGLLKDFTPLLWKSELFAVQNACFNKTEKDALIDMYEKYEKKQVNPISEFVNIITKNKSLPGINLESKILECGECEPFRSKSIKEKSGSDITIPTLVKITCPTVNNVIKSTIIGDGGTSKTWYKKQFCHDEMKKFIDKKIVDIFEHGLNGNAILSKPDDYELWNNFKPRNIYDGSSDLSHMGPVVELRDCKMKQNVINPEEEMKNYAKRFLGWFNASRNNTSSCHIL
jgi:hypothetical protein